MMQEKGYLQPNSNTVLHIQSDGCGRQYKCALGMKVNATLALQYRIAINWIITCTHHGKSLVDAIVRINKYNLCNGMIKGMSSAMIDYDMKKISEANKSCNYLNARNRTLHSKKKVHQGQRELKSRKYGVTNFNDEKPMPFENTMFELKSGFPKGTKDAGDNTKNGLSEMFNFYFPQNMSAIRRIPCLCEACHERILLPWIVGVEPE
jgi:hypothetical protein